MENAEITALDRIIVPRGADEYYERVQGVIRPFLDAVMSGARAFDECSTRLENEVLGNPCEVPCDKVAGVEAPGKSEIVAIQTIALAIGTLANKSVLADHPSALRIYAAISELAAAIRDVQEVETKVSEDTCLCQ